MYSSYPKKEKDEENYTKAQYNQIFKTNNKEKDFKMRTKETINLEEQRMTADFSSKAMQTRQ